MSYITELEKRMIAAGQLDKLEPQPKYQEDELLEKLCRRHKPTVEPNARKLFLRHEPVVDPLRAKNTQSVFNLAEAKVTSAKDNRKQNYEAPPETKEKTKLEKQHAAILAVIKLKGFDPMAIPDGKKGTIEEICRADYQSEFDTDSSFITAWKKGVRKGLFRMANHASYAKRGRE